MMSPRHGLSRTLVLAAMALVACAGPAWSAGALYVSPGGGGRDPGTPERPTSLASAVGRTSTDMTIREIVLAGGEYVVDNVNFRRLSGKKAQSCPRLVMRPAKGQAVTFRHSFRVTKARPVAGRPGVYRTDRLPPGTPSMWERDTRVRYVTLSNLASVAAYPASCFADPADKALYFRASDGKPPEAHDISCGLGRSNGRALGVYRPNTTIEDIRFLDCIGPNTHSLVLNAPNLVARRCRFENCDKGCIVGQWGTNNVIEDCVFQDVAQGVRSNGKDLTVRGCRFIKVRDRFLKRVYPSLDTGVYTYFPASGTTLIGNFVKGYLKGFRVKAAPGKYTIRHNTTVDCVVGMFWVTDNANSDTSHNIFVDAEDFIRVSRFEPSFTLDRNLFWRSRNLVDFRVRSEFVRGANLSKRNIYADPRFADPDRGDYRVLPDSPAVFLKSADGRPAGAFPVAPVEAAAKARPTVSLYFPSDTLAAGAHGALTFVRDPWIGGGESHIRDLVEGDGMPRRVAGQTKFTVWPRAFDTAGKITTTRVTVAKQAPKVTPYAPSMTIELPDKDGDYVVSFAVKNNRGVWSKPAKAVVRLDRRPPKLVGKPVILTNRNGMIVCLRADEPCFAEIDFGPTARYGATAKPPTFVKRKWESSDGGDWVETWTRPQTEFAIPVLKPHVKPGQRVHLRLRLKDQGGLKSESEDFVAAIKGRPRSLFVSTKGKDAISRGAANAPLRTLQYAVDRALPGDRVVMAPGVYKDYTLLTHGGVDEENRITIEAEKPGTVNADVAHREPAVIALEKAPYVTIRGLRLLYSTKAGVYAYNSPYTRVERCTVYNGPGSVKGYHLFFFRSPHATVTRCLGVGAETGFYFLESPHATVTHNTVSQSLYACAGYDISLAGTTQMNNSFCFGGNDNFKGSWRHPDEFRTFRSDYNNLGTVIRPYTVNHMKKNDPKAYRQVMAEKFKPKYGTRRFRFRVNSKRILSMGREPYHTMKKWREATGQDKHSVFADPKYVKPYGVLDRWDWRVKPDSPNVGAGEGGATIGAFAAEK